MIKKRFKVEVHSFGFTSTFVVEVDSDYTVEHCYDYNDTSYILDDIDGIRHIYSRINSLIEITPLVAEISYKEKNGIQESKKE